MATGADGGTSTVPPDVRLPDGGAPDGAQGRDLGGPPPDLRGALDTGTAPDARPGHEVTAPMDVGGVPDAAPEPGPDASAETDDAAGPAADLSAAHDGTTAADGTGPDDDSGPAPDVDPGPLCGEGDDEKTLVPAAVTRIVNGVPAHDPRVVTLPSGQVLAIGALFRSTWDWWHGTWSWSQSCTATVIGARAVLTAAHCVDGVSDPAKLQVRLGTDVSAPVAVLDVAQVRKHPDYRGRSEDASHDVALLILTEDVQVRAPEVRWIPPNLEALPRHLVGQRVQNVGYGATVGGWGGGGDNTRRWWTVEEVTAVSASDFTVYGGGRSSVCYGDSGGPSLYTYPDGTVRVIGVVSWGDPSCVDYDHFARIDDSAAWLTGLLPASDPCAGETGAGRCEGDVVVWCAASPARAFAALDCALDGGQCDPDAAGAGSGAAGCVPGGCGDLTWDGRCTPEGVARWCEDGAPKQRRCPPCDQGCAWGDDGLGWYCRP
jgi:V8-like Glu-specific endopeptidase